MSLDWYRWIAAQRVNIHWGARVLLVQWGKDSVQELPCQPTWGREQVLAALGHALLSGQRPHATSQSNPQKPSNRPLRLHITLGASLCPVSSQPLPQGIRHWEEVRAWAQAHLARQWPGQALRCALDPAHPQIAAGVDQGLVDALDAWAQDLGAEIASLRPLWSIATECRLAGLQQIQTLMVQERDALTLIHQSGHQSEVNVQPLLEAQDPEEAVQATVRRWRVAHQLDANAVLHLRFGEKGQTQRLTGGPDRWTHYWSKA